MLPFQSTRPRGARLDCFVSARGQRPVSIHAPARGATPAPLCTASCWIVSIHAPARGATRRRNMKYRLNKFQSTRPRGARPVFVLHFCVVVFVSIHAPARGATHEASLLTSPDSRFNPRARAGRDFQALLILPRHSTFQSTRPRGARLVHTHLKYG